MKRLPEIADNLAKIMERVDRACALAARNPSEITLIAVTKTYPASDLEILSELGIKNVGENKDQEAREKHSEIKSDLDWHFVGQLQTNKVKSVVNYADFIHSVDRIRLAREINKSAQLISKRIQVFIQVDLGGDDPNRGGVSGEGLIELAQWVSESSNLDMAGLMAVAPLGEDPPAAFARLADIRSDFLKLHPTANLLSAGMSGDFEQAIGFGATHLRIGSLLLGVRPSLL